MFELPKIPLNVNGIDGTNKKMIFRELTYIAYQFSVFV